MDWQDELEAHEREQRAEQIRMFRALSMEERLNAALAFDREMTALRPALDLAGSWIDRQRDAAMRRVELAMGPDPAPSDDAPS